MEWSTEWSNGGNGRMAEMATYVLFTVHTNTDTDNDDDDDDTLIFYSIDAKKCTGYSIPIGMFEKVIQIAKKQPSLK